MVNIIKKNKMAAAVALVYIILLVLRKEMAFEAFNNSSYYLIEMAQILPVIFMLTVSIDVLIPKEWIVKRLGNKSGVFGAALALAFGSLSAGPIYAAFPIAKTLYNKGASVGNVVVILSAWAVIKVPMLANEAKFLGPKFMTIRWILTVIFIFAIGYIMDKMKIQINEEEVINQDIFVKKFYCMGCTACSIALPEIFTMKDGKAYVANKDILLDQLDDITKKELEMMVSKCPSKAIEVKW